MTAALPLMSEVFDGVPSPFFTFDGEGYVTSANQAAADLVNQTREAVLGRHLQSEYGELLSERWHQAARAAVDEQQQVEYETYNAGLARWLRVRLTPLNGGVAVHLQDVTETKRLSQLAALSEALGGVGTPAQVVELTVHQLLTLTGASRSAVFGYQETAPLTLLATSGDVPEACGAPQVPASALDALEHHRHVVEVLRPPCFGCRAAVPLSAGGQLLAVLVLEFGTSETLSASTEQFVLALAQQCAQALARVRSWQTTEETRARFEFLAEASVLLAASLDIHETAQHLAQLTASRVAAWAALFLPDAQGQLAVAGMARQEAAQKSPGDVLEQHPLGASDLGNVSEVYRSGVPTLLERHDALAGEQPGTLLSGPELHALVHMPVQARGRTIGVLSLGWGQVQLQRLPEDVQLAEELARRVANTLENARLYAAARDGAARLSGIISAVSDAVITAEAQTERVVVFNAAAEQLFGVSEAEAAGTHLRRFVPVGDHEPAFEGAAERAPLRREVLAARADGSVFPAEATFSGVVVNGQHLITAVLRDVSEAQHAEKVLRESEERFRATFDQAAVGMAHLSLDGQWQLVNQTLCEILGYSRDELLQLAFAQITHPDDLAADLSHTERLLSGEVRTFSVHKRFLRKDQTEVWTKVTGSLLRTEQGEARAFIAVVEDISDIKRTEEQLQGIRNDLEQRVQTRTTELQVLSEQLQLQVQALEQHNEETRLLGEMSELLQACFTQNEVERVVAQYLALLFRHVPGALYSFGPSKNILEELVSWTAQASSAPLFGPSECWGLRRGRPFVTRGGRDLQCQHVTSDLPTLCIPMLAQGETVGLLYLQASGPEPFTSAQERLAQTVSETVALAIVNLRLRETLRQQSIRDSLTGLFNRRYLEETFEREMRRALRNKEPIALIMLDVDHFKHFNDAQGHDGGDVLLKALGGLLKDTIRAEDVACRYGGEEFTLLLMGATLEDAAERAERIRLAVQNLQITYQGQTLGGVSASFGVAAFPHHGLQLNDLIRAADFALYRAKREGRNRVERAAPGG